MTVCPLCQQTNEVNIVHEYKKYTKHDRYVDNNFTNLLYIYISNDT